MAKLAAKKSGARASVAFLSRESGAVSHFTLNAVDLRAPSMKWSYLAGNRAKWQELPEESSRVSEDAVGLLKALGIGEARLRELARARLIEVRIPWTREEDGWEERVLPWEFLFVRALQPVLEGERGPLIVRHLMVASVSAPKPVGQVIGILSCPRESPLRASYEKELKLVESHIRGGANPPDFRRVVDATRGGVEAAIDLAEDGCAIHFLGIESARDDRRASHLWLSDPAAGTNECGFEEVARLLTANGRRHPRLVAYSFCSTGPRLAAFTVACGAHAAIGFQDVVTDEQCESFFGRFYCAWPRLEWNVAATFEAALRDVAPMLHGAGIILWTDRSLLDDPIFRRAPAPAPGSGEVPAAVDGAIPFVIPHLPAPPSRHAHERIDVAIEVNEDINYSVLHNQRISGVLPSTQRSLFRQFQIRRLDSTPLHVDIEVNLHSGDQVCAWRRFLPITHASTDLASSIHVPLTSVLARSLHESVRTTVESIVRLDGETVHHATHPANLLAVEEWRDDDICHIWLPSFVLPRDPAVAEIAQRARRYLAALADDCSAGFDGFQLRDPARVDRQAQAFWATLLLDSPLGYINPPPTFTAQSQRLRRPGSVLREGSGTCLDLALLLAACLEHIGLRPVLILCPGHAFAGWWRSEEASLPLFSEIANRVTERYDDDSAASAAASSSPEKEHRQPSPWTKGKETHRAIVDAVDQGDLAVIETTGLTRALSFARARREGEQRLRSRLDFECLIDVRTAREHQVTPLPMCD